MQFGLSEEQEMIVFMVCVFVENEIYLYEFVVEKIGYVLYEFGEEFKQKCIDFGFYVCNFFEEVGGVGFVYMDFMLVECEFGCGFMVLMYFFG